MQEELVEILRHKGIGPKGSKHISHEECLKAFDLILDESCALTTKSTFLTALFLLDSNENELALIKSLKENIKQVDEELRFLITGETSNELEQIILKAVNLIDLNEEDSEKGISISFDSKTPEHLTASFLEALRLKRETDLENKSFYNHFLTKTKRVACDFDQLIEIGDSYDGVKRNNNYNLFTATVLASLGYKVFISGNYTCAPKNGVTHQQVLREANKNPFLNLEDSIKHLETHNWVYIDQSVFYPSLWDERTMREEMVKRPCIATFEKILSPISNKTGNDIITSYTHAHYKNANIEILRNSPYTKTALNIKGLEGTVTPKHNVSTPVVKYTNNSVNEIKYKFSDTKLKPIKDLSAKETLNQGLTFIKDNENNQASQYVKNTCALILTALGYEESIESTFLKIENAINSGKVIKTWSKSLVLND